MSKRRVTKRVSVRMTEVVKMRVFGVRGGGGGDVDERNNV